MTRILLAIALIALCGCDVEEQEKRNSDLMPARRISDMGNAAEVRLWKTQDGSTWCVVGRPERFAVWRKPPTADWALEWTTESRTQQPPQVKLELETKP